MSLLTLSNTRQKNKVAANGNLLINNDNYYHST